jgi:hypothetical protein
MLLLRRITLITLFSLLGIVVAGCSGPKGPELTRITGVVTFEGKPVGPGTVAFLPSDPTGSPASGTIEKNGTFKMSMFNPGDGALPGSYKVAVTVIKEPVHGDEKGNLFPATFLSPERYMNPETSGFTITVEKRKPQDVKFELKP